MNEEAKKLYLINEIVKLKDSAVLAEVETVLAKGIIHTSERRSFKDFAGTITEEEAKELEKIIEEGCEQIHPDDWK